MKIYLLKVKNFRDVGYDQYEAFVVRASSPHAARRTAQDCADLYGQPFDLFLDTRKTTCEEVRPTGRPEIILGANIGG